MTSMTSQIASKAHGLIILDEVVVQCIEEMEKGFGYLFHLLKGVESIDGMLKGE
ncbi:MAG: hypothetical protein H0Z28_12690 [Archaeoglobus sp.]|nr:hypothetical protein [Archaeoglobus sp.]